MPRRSRVRAGELLINRWRLPTWWVLILPLAVILKRFLAPDLVFILDILLPSKGYRMAPAPVVACARTRAGVRSGLPRHVRPGRPRGARLRGISEKKQAPGGQTVRRRRCDP